MKEKELPGSLTDIDYQKGLTSRLIDIIDKRIDELISHTEEDVEDIEDILEYIENIAGLGFVVLQQYMTVVCGNLQKEVLQKGPKYNDSKTFSEIVNASANYWKHHGAWPLDENCRDKDKRIKATDAIMRSVCDGKDPLVSNDTLVSILSKLSNTKKGQFNAVFKKILEWRKELRKTAKEQNP